MRATVDRPGLDSQGRSPLIKIRRVRKGDLSKVRDVIEQAFGDFFERQVGTRPRQVFGGAQYVHHRWLMEPWGCFVAEEGDGKIVGAAVAVMWGTVGVIGPVAVLTHYQNQDIGQQLLTACQEFFDENKATLQGVATYPYSPKHLIFYQKYGYRPKGLVVVTSKALDRAPVGVAKPAAKPGAGVRRYSTLEEARKKQVMQKIRRITNHFWRGLDVSKEIEIVDGLTLGDTLLLEKGREVIGFAVCHLPPNSEAPHGSAYVKLLAIDSAHRKPEHLQALIAGRGGDGGLRPAPARRRACLHVLLDRVPDAPRARLPRGLHHGPHEAGQAGGLRGRQRSGAGRLALIRVAFPFRPASAAALLLMACLTLAAPRAASPHAIVLESSPTHDAVLPQPPARVTLRFNSRIEKRFTRVTLALADRAPVAVAVPPGDAEATPDRLTIPLQPLGPGVYVLRYRVLAVDGHITEGALRFTVGAGR